MIDPQARTTEIVRHTISYNTSFWLAFVCFWSSTFWLTSEKFRKVYLEDSIELIKYKFLKE